MCRLLLSRPLLQCFKFLIMRRCLLLRLLLQLLKLRLSRYLLCSLQASAQLLYLGLLRVLALLHIT